MTGWRNQRPSRPAPRPHRVVASGAARSARAGVRITRVASLGFRHHHHHLLHAFSMRFVLMMEQQ